MSSSHRMCRATAASPAAPCLLLTLALHCACSLRLTPAPSRHSPLRCCAGSALKRFDACADCAAGVAELSALRAAGQVRGPNAHNRAMRLCAASEIDEVEKLYDELASLSLCDDTSRALLVTTRLQHGRLPEAAAGTAELLGSALSQGRCRARTARLACSVLSACEEAGVNAGAAAARWREVGAAGLVPAPPAPPAPPPALERTLALLKPDCVRAGATEAIERLAHECGFATVCRRRWRMDEHEAAAFLAASWGSTSGDARRRFFAEMVRFCECRRQRPRSRRPSPTPRATHPARLPTLRVPCNHRRTHSSRRLERRGCGAAARAARRGAAVALASGAWRPLGRPRERHTSRERAREVGREQAGQRCTRS